MKTQLGRDELRTALSALGEILGARGLHYELVLVGGGSLLLRGLISRPTRDADILGQRTADGEVVPMRTLPAPLGAAIHDVALTYDLTEDWLNLGPEALLDLGLPPGFVARMTPMTLGGLVVWLAGRVDLLHFKLYAAADHWPRKDRHLADLRALDPTRPELLAAARWAGEHDPSPAFRDLLVAVLRDLGIGDADDALG